MILELVEEYVNYEWYQIGNESVLNESSSITVTDTGTFMYGLKMLMAVPIYQIMQ